MVLPLLLALSASGQEGLANGNEHINALVKSLSTLKNDTNKVKTLNDIAFEYNKVSPYDGIKFANESIELAEKLKWELGIARANSCLGANYFSLSDFPKAYKYWLIALGINEELGNKVGVANHLHNIGNVFYSQKNYPLALDYYEKGLKSSEEIGNRKIITHSYTAIANVYGALKNYAKALEYNFKALEIDEKNNVKGDIAADKINIAAIYNEKKDYTKALDMLFYGKDIKKAIGDKNGLANAYYMIGMVYFNLANNKNNAPDDKNLRFSMAYLDSAISLDKEIGYLDNMQKSYKCLSDAQQLSNDFKSAFTSYTLYNTIKDSIFSTDKQSEIFNLEKKEEIEEKKRDDERALEAKERIEYLQMGGICIFIVTLIISLLVLRKKKINPQAIDLLCTFSVLVFFEFVNILIHGKIETLTNHNLILTLLCLLVIAAIILPVHHKIEHWVKKKVVAEDQDVQHHH